MEQRSPDSFLVRIWGARGSIPAPGPETVRYGGNTPCIEVRCGKELIILDAGSGIRKLGDALLDEQPLDAVILFSHLHWDHIQGFPFFRPAFLPENRFRIYARRQLNTTLQNLLAGQMMYPHFPKSLEDMAAEMSFHELDLGEALHLGEVRVIPAPTNHPDACLAFRIEYKNRAMVYATDTEHFESVDPVLKQLSRNADCLIYDTMFTEDEYLGRNGQPPRAGWGHSTWREGVRLAQAAGVRRLVLFHYNPSHDDDFIARMEQEARKLFPETYAAYEGLTFELNPLETA